MLLELHVEAGRKAKRQQVRANDLGELGLGQEQEVLLRAAHDRERRDHARLRCQEECVAGLTRTKRRDVVGHHALQVVLGRGPAHTHKSAWAQTDCRSGGVVESCSKCRNRAARPGRPPIE